MREFRDQALFGASAALAVAALSLGASGGSATRAPRIPPSLCRADETVLFQCRIGASLAAVCGGHGARAYAQYRHGQPGRLDLIYPAATDGGPGTMTRAFTGFAGGGESQIRFVNHGVEYVIYSSTVRTGFGRDGHNNPRFSDGILMRRNGRRIADLACGGTLHPVDSGAAPGFLPEGEMVARE